MRKTIGAIVIWACLAGTAWAQEMRVITVTGEGRIEAVPDMATISLGVTHEAAQADAAMALTSAAVRAVIDRLTGAGIAARDMQTSGLSLQPLWENRVSSSDAPPRIAGFVARNGVTVRVRDLTGLGGILDMVVQDGANTFNGLQFGLQAPDPVEAEARAAAVRDAMARAAQLAQAAGVTLGPVQSISQQGQGRGPVMMEMSAASRSMGDVPVAPGELSIDAQVSMVFAIAD